MYYNDCVLPTGDLREPRAGARRADVIIVTKCPKSLKEEGKIKIIKEINPSAHQAVFFSTIAYSKKVFSAIETRDLKQLPAFTLVTGIANAAPLVSFLRAEGLNFKHLEFKDHYSFTETDFKNLDAETLLLTTEKDFMRLKNSETLKPKLFYLPIEVQIENFEAFNALIKTFVAKF